MKNVRRVIKYIFIALILIFNIALVVRIWMMNDTSVLSGLLINEKIKSSYASDPSGFSVEKYTVVEKLAQNGEFSAYALVYIPSINQLQVTVRINDSILEGYSLSSTEVISFAISDSAENFTNFQTARLSEKRFMYNYIKLVFDDITLPETVINEDEVIGTTTESKQLNLFSYMNNGEKRFAGIILYDSRDEAQEYKLSKSEINELTK